MMNTIQDESSYANIQQISVQFQKSHSNTQSTHFDQIFLESLFKNSEMNQDQQNQYIVENQKWWNRSTYSIGVLKMNDKELIKISYQQQFNPMTDFLMSYKDNNGIIYKIHLISQIDFDFTNDSLAEIDYNNMIVSSIEILGKHSSNIARGIQIAFQTQQLKKKDIEEMIEQCIFEEDNSLKIYKQLKPSL